MENLCVRCAHEMILHHMSVCCSVCKFVSAPQREQRKKKNTKENRKLDVSQHKIETSRAFFFCFFFVPPEIHKIPYVFHFNYCFSRTRMADCYRLSQAKLFLLHTIFSLHHFPHVRFVRQNNTIGMLTLRNFAFVDFPVSLFAISFDLCFFALSTIARIEQTHEKKTPLHTSSKESFSIFCCYEIWWQIKLRSFRI